MRPISVVRAGCDVAILGGLLILNCDHLDGRGRLHLLPLTAQQHSYRDVSK